VLAIGKLLVITVYIGYAAVVCWRLRTGSELQAEIAETRSWVRCTPPWRLFAGLLVPTVPVVAEVVCVINGLLWPVEMLTRPWRSKRAAVVTASGPWPGTDRASRAEGSVVNAERYPALSADHDALLALTLVLPPGLGNDQVLAGLIEAIGQVRAEVAARAQLFQLRAQERTAGGDQLGQALCRGQALGGEHAATAIDEAIIGVFDLWGQYETQLRAAGGAPARPAPGAPRPEGDCHDDGPGWGRRRAWRCDGGR
jgi:hypothetical protein